MDKQKTYHLMLHKGKNVINQGVLSLDENSECSEDEDFDPTADSLPLSSESSEESSKDDSNEDAEHHRGASDLTVCSGIYWNADGPFPNKTVSSCNLRKP